MTQDFWRLPRGVDEVLPPRARHLELLRRDVLDLFERWGYDYIEPPIIEYLDALLVGNDLNLQTLQVADQISGRTLGVRADITSQAARIDANSLSQRAPDGGFINNGVRRLCYAGPVAKANPPGVLESRVPLKAGAEIYGCSENAADLEIMCLAVDALSAAGLDEVIIELGHVGLVDGLVGELQLAQGESQRLLEAVRIKSEADICALLDSGTQERASAIAEQLCKLVRLMGGAEALAAARELFSSEQQNLLELIDQLDYCAARLAEERPNAVVRFDLSAQVGFGYHHGLVFALFERSHGRAVARGGRYDGIGEQFGNARPATGFDLNLKALIGLTSVAERIGSAARSAGTVWVPFAAGLERSSTEQRAQRMSALREQGFRVVQGLTPDEPRPESCTHELTHASNEWQLATVDKG